MDFAKVIKVNDVPEMVHEILAGNTGYSVKSVTAVSDDNVIVVFSQAEADLHEDLNDIHRKIEEMYK